MFMISSQKYSAKLTGCSYRLTPFFKLFFMVYFLVLRICVVHKGVKSIEELLQSAALYHIASESMPDSNAYVLKSLSELKQQVVRLSIQSAPSLAPMQSNTLRGVHCVNAVQLLNSDSSQNHCSQVHNNNRCVNYSRQPKDVSIANSFGPHLSRVSRFDLQSNWYTKGRQSSFTSQSRFRPNFNSQRSQQFSSIPKFHVVDCTKCGKLHRLNEKCPAFGLQCRFCGQKTHCSFCLLLLEGKVRF